MLGNRKYAFYGIHFALPAEWHLIDRPDKSAPDYQIRTWKAREGQELHLAHWSAPPRTDGGVMVTTHEWETVVAGQKTKLLETSTFQGVKRKVLVVFFAKGKDNYRIYSEGIPCDRFQSILSSIS